MVSVGNKTLVCSGVVRSLQRVEIPGAVEEERSEPVVTSVPAMRLFEVAPDDRVFRNVIRTRSGQQATSPQPQPSTTSLSSGPS